MSSLASRGAAAKAAASTTALADALAMLQTENEFTRALPDMVKEHGFDAIDAALSKIFSASQRKKCWEETK